MSHKYLYKESKNGFPSRLKASFIHSSTSFTTAGKHEPFLVLIKTRKHPNLQFPFNSSPLKLLCLNVFLRNPTMREHYFICSCCIFFIALTKRQFVIVHFCVISCPCCKQAPGEEERLEGKSIALLSTLPDMTLSDLGKGT